MPIIQQQPLGAGRVVWLGVNTERGTFSHARHMVTIGYEGIVGDMYCGRWREIASHDVDYIATDGIAKGDTVLNHRQITIVDVHEVRKAGVDVDVTFEPGMLRENIGVEYVPHTSSTVSFSKLPQQSRMVLGTSDPKVLILTEENGPCRTIARPIAMHLGCPDDQRLIDSLNHRRGQMAMVRSFKSKDIYIGDTFKIFPPM